jgi:hypothetical protein
MITQDKMDILDEQILRDDKIRSPHLNNCRIITNSESQAGIYGWELLPNGTNQLLFV